MAQGEATAAETVAEIRRRVTDSGAIIGEETSTTTGLAELLALVESGAADDAGYHYVVTGGACGRGACGSAEGEEVRFQRIERVQLGNDGDKAKNPPLPHSVTDDRATLSPEILSLLSEAHPGDEIAVHITLKSRPTTTLRAPVLFGYPDSEELGAYRKARKARVDARIEEVAQLQAPVVELLTALGAKDISPSSITTDVSARLSAGALTALAAQPDVSSLGVASGATAPGNWDGEDAKASGGENTELTIASGYAAAGQTAMIVDDHFKADHVGFFNCSPAQCGTRVVGIANCNNNPCTASLPVPTSDHGTGVAGVVAGDLRDGQNGDGWSDAVRQRYTGAAEEAWLYLVRGTSTGGIRRAIDLAITQGVDVVSTSRHVTSDTDCDGTTEYSLHVKAHELYMAGILFTVHAGNIWGGGGQGCTMLGLSDSLSIFTVGGLGDSMSDCTSSTYLTSACGWFGPLGDGTLGSARGGVKVWVNGGEKDAAVTAVDAAAPAWWNHAYRSDGGYGTAVGTSFAQPQVAGAALLYRDWYLANHGTWVDNPGAMVVAMLAMTDRWGTATSGFSSMHGGGRFQARRYGNADHQGAWGWQSYGPVYLSNGQSFQVNVSGSGNEPATINQFKAYAVFPEDDPSDVADIDLFVYDLNCGAGATKLGSDTSYDVKSMVRLNGSQAAGKALCVKVTAPHVPSGETRPVTLFMYYSYDTSGR